MKKFLFVIVFTALVVITFLSGCVEPAYYREHHYHSERYYHRHHRTPPPGIDVRIHN
jgi:hypothetical protein